VAIIYCCTNGLLDDVPVNEVRAFERDFLVTMRTSHPDALNLLRAGKLEDSAINAIKQTAKDLSARFRK
ncbi:MAG: F0F1 ATP synthase subunit alpha, partial [Adhaeribacter sp.]